MGSAWAGVAALGCAGAGAKGFASTGGEAGFASTGGGAAGLASADALGNAAASSSVL